ncbi:uncharacterized protein LOC141708818 [Apium graveolens]|uniref:uncharacterized protein LOC141708818 n=1 Tax=Apium graveolens TaxID=4045 RepID=UPI003D7B97B2
MKVENLNVFSDSMIVVYQINGGYQAKGPRTELYLKCAQRIIERFNEGIELIGELPKAKGGVKYAVVAVDYFTKWAEAEPLVDPAKLEEKKGTWPEELAQVLWSYNTTPRTTTGETPFSLVYGCEAMVLFEVGACSFRRDNYDSEANEVNHRLYLDMIEETREDAQIRIAAYQQRTTRHYNSKVRAHTFKVGDLVLRRVMLNTKVVSHRVFGVNWEGPYDRRNSGRCSDQDSSISTKDN